MNLPYLPELPDTLPEDWSHASLRQRLAVRADRPHISAYISSNINDRLSFIESSDSFVPVSVLSSKFVYTPKAGRTISNENYSRKDHFPPRRPRRGWRLHPRESLLPKGGTSLSSQDKVAHQCCERTSSDDSAMMITTPMLTEKDPVEQPELTSSLNHYLQSRNVTRGTYDAGVMPSSLMLPMFWNEIATLKTTLLLEERKKTCCIFSH